MARADENAPFLLRILGTGTQQEASGTASLQYELTNFMVGGIAPSFTYKYISLQSTRCALEHRNQTGVQNALNSHQTLLAIWISQLRDLNTPDLQT